MSEIAKETIKSFKDSPLARLWAIAWTKARGSMIAISFLLGFVTTALFDSTILTATTFIAFIVLAILVAMTYNKAKKAMVTETE